MATDKIEPFHGPPICDWSLSSCHLELLQLDGVNLSLESEPR
jgi:hypothetical protein